MRQRVVRTGSLVLVFAALGAAAAAWFTPTPELDAADAAALAQDALAEAGVDAELAGAPRKEEHQTREGEDVPVWVVFAETEVGGRTEQIEMRVQRSAGRLVYVDDRVGPDDAEPLLSDDEFEALGAIRDDSHREDWVRRNVLAGASALLIAGTAAGTASRADRLRSRP